MNEIENQEPPLGLMSLPAELLTYIVCKLQNPKDLASLNATNVVFHSILSKQPSVWVSHSKRWGYARGITMRSMNLLSKAYLVLWVARKEGAVTTERPMPIVGIVYDVVDPVSLRGIKLMPRVLTEFKSRINVIVTSPFPYHTKHENETWGKFETMTSMSDKKILKQAKSCWAIGPLGKNFYHLVILEYVIKHCFSVAKISSKAEFQLLFEPSMCGMVLSAILAELKCRAYYIGSNLSIENAFGNLVLLFPSLGSRGKRKAILELQKQYVDIDASEKPWCLINPLAPPLLPPLLPKTY